jgi:hypothetical protein
MALEASMIAAISAITTTAAAAGQAYYAHEASEQSQKAERLRARQMRLDALRKQRETIRKAILAQSMATARGTAQGVGEGSSVIGGAFGQTMGTLGRDFAYTAASERIGEGIFSANAAMADAQGTASAFGQLGNFAQAGLRHSNDIAKLTQTLFAPSQSSPWSTTVTTADAEYRGTFGHDPHAI